MSHTGWHYNMHKCIAARAVYMHCPMHRWFEEFWRAAGCKQPTSSINVPIQGHSSRAAWPALSPPLCTGWRPCMQHIHHPLCFPPVHPPPHPTPQIKTVVDLRGRAERSSKKKSDKPSSSSGPPPLLNPQQVDALGASQGAQDQRQPQASASTSQGGSEPSADRMADDPSMDFAGTPPPRFPLWFAVPSP